MTTPPVEPGPLHRAGKPADSFETYNRVAETVGMVPSFRKFDYIFQGTCVTLGAVVGAGVGWFFPGVFDILFGHSVSWEPELAAIFGGVGGFIVMGILSGLVLMVMGWVRAMKK